MRLVTFDDNQLGLLVGTKVVNIGSVPRVSECLPKNATMVDLIKNYHSIEEQLRQLESVHDNGVSIESITLMPPITNPGKVICTVDNYPAHAAEDITEVFPKPIFFLKPSNTLIGHKASVVLPKEARRVDYELELAVVIGKECRRVPVADVSSFIFGYTIFLDMSARDFRTIPYSWFSMKGWDTFGPIGPVLVTRDEIISPLELEMKLWVNGEQRMQGNTRDMIFSIAKLVEAVSEVTTLFPGDIIATGTIAGVAPVFEGDVLVAEIEKLGNLEINVVRSQDSNVWHCADFPDHYAAYRERDVADKAPLDPIAPGKGE